MSDFLAKLVKIAGTTNQSEIARKLGIPNTTLSNWISRGVSKAGALKIAETYNVSVEYVLTGQGELVTPIVSYEPSSSIIELIDTLKEMEKQGKLTAPMVQHLNHTLSTFQQLESINDN